eukprot:GHVN01049740.1.p1 GENE.GHVN01049740.1~~GHVN01049740.1.p1  ORF type:complete len:134 (+),score=18.00 GHVN01049740.1:467-868(+)
MDTSCTDGNDKRATTNSQSTLLDGQVMVCGGLSGRAGWRNDTLDTTEIILRPTEIIFTIHNPLSRCFSGLQPTNLKSIGDAAVVELEGLRGVLESERQDHPTSSSSSAPALKRPHEHLCPINIEVMADPRAPS